MASSAFATGHRCMAHAWESRGRMAHASPSLASTGVRGLGGGLLEVEPYGT